MICSIKAQAKVSGVVSKVIIANRNTDAAGQIADIRNLISSGANVIVTGSALYRDPEGLEHAVTALRSAADAAR